MASITVDGSDRIERAPADGLNCAPDQGPLIPERGAWKLDSVIYVGTSCHWVLRLEACSHAALAHGRQLGWASERPPVEDEGAESADSFPGRAD